MRKPPNEYRDAEKAKENPPLIDHDEHKRMKRVMDYNQGPVWNSFGLTRANYFVMPRRVLQSMPAHWQAQFVGLMDELHETLDYDEPLEGYKVCLADEDDDEDCVCSDPMSEYRHIGPLPLK